MYSISFFRHNSLLSTIENMKESEKRRLKKKKWTKCNWME